MNTQLLLVDDHRIFLDGMTELLQKTDDLEVVAVATDATEALQQAADHLPEVVITDITLPGTDGVALTKRLRREYPDMKVICLTMHADAQLVETMFKAGALAYVLKDCEMSELVDAVKKALKGETYMSRSVAEAVADSFRLEGSAASHEADVSLTEREHQVLLMLADGLSTRQIAAKLHLSVKTIGTYRENVMQKLHIHSVAGLTKYAIRKGLTTAN